MNDIGTSFAMLSSVKKIHDLIDWEFLPVDSTIQGSKIWKTKLFRDLGVGYYWVQLDLRDSVKFTTEHVIAVHILADWKLCTDPKQNIAFLTDNRDGGDYVQKCDIDDLTDEDAGEKIFRLFLDLPNSRVTSIIRLKSRTWKNSTYRQASETELEYRGRRLTRYFSSACSMKSAPISSCQIKKKAVKRSSRGKRRRTIHKVFDKYMHKDTSSL